ncbi:transglycosylase domain-containing protein [Pseudalkalibacillus decolorationis]|uniref:transglycosylase domain-containing protein n=1 Tax=Pseudalkalibacillus decolorationis TaxID=163879 RepID=UPI0021494C51|nr:PBP1A family penicillin-binding protein [Pseudalkalibacillus decolorationis]
MPSRLTKRKTRKKQQKKNGYIKVFLATFLVFLLILIAGGITGFALIQGAPPLDPDKLNNPQSSAIYDMNDNKIVDLAGKEHRIKIQIDNVPQHVQEAFIATEDARFREHFGLDPKRIAGAALANIKEGWGAEGGSTITQQVIKNTYLSPEKTLERKVQEAYLAIKLEQKYSKDEILEMYLNKIYFGHGAYGIGAAADVYFGKKVEELTLAEASLLAGLPQRPSGYDPVKYPERAIERRNIVLSLMEQHGYISSKEAEKAKTTQLDKLLVDQSEGPKYESFIDQVINDLTEKGISEKALYTGGLKIYTTMDTETQKYTEEVLSTNKHVKFPNEKFKAGIVLLDTKSGAIRAIGGNRNGNESDVKRGFNYATDTRRQPGSTIKPILAYGPAIEYKQWSTYHQIKDEALEINGKQFQNWDQEYHGMISMREALVKSYNIPAIKAFMEVENEKAKEFAGRLGIPLDHAYPSYAIGGFKYGVSPLQMAGAYATFGNEGMYHDPYTVRKVVYPTGKTKAFESKGEKAMNQYTAYMITDMLKDVVRSGTGTRANIDGLPLAGKTGTTNPPEGIEGGSTDAWFAGYTTQYTAAVWTGYDKTTQEQYVTNKDSVISQIIFKKVMAHVSDRKETKDFEKPSTVVEVEIDERTGRKASASTSQSSITEELFVKGTDLPNAYNPAPPKKDNDSNKDEDTEKGTEKKESEKEKQDAKEKDEKKNNEKDETESDDSNENENTEETGDSEADDGSANDDGTGEADDGNTGDNSGDGNSDDETDGSGEGSGEGDSGGDSGDGTGGDGSGGGDDGDTGGDDSGGDTGGGSDEDSGSGGGSDNDTGDDSGGGTGTTSDDDDSTGSTESSGSSADTTTR